MWLSGRTLTYHATKQKTRQVHYIRFALGRGLRHLCAELVGNRQSMIWLVSLSSQGPRQPLSLTRAYLCAITSRVRPSTGLHVRQCPRSRRSRTHSRGGKRSTSLLGGVQSRYTACRTSSSKDNTSFSSASERPCLRREGTTHCDRRMGKIFRGPWTALGWGGLQRHDQCLDSTPLELRPGAAQPPSKNTAMSATGAHICRRLAHPLETRSPSAVDGAPA